MPSAIRVISRIFLVGRHDEELLKTHIVRGAGQAANLGHKDLLQALGNLQPVIAGIRYFGSSLHTGKCLSIINIHRKALCLNSTAAAANAPRNTMIAISRMPQGFGQRH